jgi:hypothetical protein
MVTVYSRALSQTQIASASTPEKMMEKTTNEGALPLVLPKVSRRLWI